jgi:hypothetical protein
MRFFFLVILFAGLALGVVYPMAVRNVSGYEIGTYPLFDADGFKWAEVQIAPSEAPVRVRLRMRVAERLVVAGPLPVLRLSASTGGVVVFDQVVTFAGIEPQPAAELGGFVYEDETATVERIDGDDAYVFTLGPAVGNEVLPERIDLVLNAGAFDLDPRAVPIGYALVAVGLVGLVAMIRRRRRLNRENPPPPRWGRKRDADE